MHFKEIKWAGVSSKITSPQPQESDPISQIISFDRILKPFDKSPGTITYEIKL